MIIWRFQKYGLEQFLIFHCAESSDVESGILSSELFFSLLKKNKRSVWLRLNRPLKENQTNKKIIKNQFQNKGLSLPNFVFAKIRVGFRLAVNKPRNPLPMYTAQHMQAKTEAYLISSKSYKKVSDCRFFFCFFIQSKNPSLFKEIYKIYKKISKDFKNISKTFQKFVPSAAALHSNIWRPGYPPIFVKWVEIAQLSQQQRTRIFENVSKIEKNIENNFKMSLGAVLRIYDLKIQCPRWFNIAKRLFRLENSVVIFWSNLKNLKIRKINEKEKKNMKKIGYVSSKSCKPFYNQ